MKKCNHDFEIQIVGKNGQDSCPSVIKYDGTITCFFGVNQICRKCGYCKCGSTILIREVIENLGLQEIQKEQPKKKWYQKLWRR